MHLATLPYLLGQPVYEFGKGLVKTAGDAVLANKLTGQLYASDGGRWILLSVPNALVRGVFDALHIPGIELPPNSTGGPFNAHISVMRPEELEAIGGADKVTERGHMFHYNLGPLKEVVPGGWKEMSKCWYIEVRSPELERLRKSYGLSALPKNDEYALHITCGVRRRGVLFANDVSKGDA